MTQTLTPAAGSPRTIAVIGGGVVGTAVALVLSTKGYQVKLFEQGDIGAGTSSGNAGGIVTGAVLPTATPGVLRAIPSYIFNPDSAAVLRPSYFLRILPWLLRFIAAGSPQRVASIASALEPLVSRAMKAHLALTGISKAQDRIDTVGWLKVYTSDASFAETAFERELMRRHGVNFSVLNAEEIEALEPKLAKGVCKHGIFQPESGFVNFPKGLTQAYFECAREHGTQHIRETVQELRPSSAVNITVKTDRRTETFDAVVVAAGAWSKQFARQCGDDVCLDTERGYHMSFRANGKPLLTRPVSFPDQHFVLSPMHDGVSMVSGDELAGVDAPPDFRRIRRLVPAARRALPGIADAEVQREWMGYRPSTPDSLPVIGRSPHHRNVFYAFGHGHLGLTLSAITAQLIGGLVADDPVPFDMTPYRINRF
ncbi:FAD-binding oxidoreductase [Oxalobacteraceae bacterium OM1]|nr:FAD-binding oxidoreductase [Oxalobacteraceae bacterium OM1]